MRTARLVLREWAEADRAAFVAMHADRVVMDLMPSVLSKSQCDVLIERNLLHFAQHGFGLWSVEVPEGQPFIGYVGLVHTPFVAPFTPCVELAWMLARDHWGNGYALEAARSVIERAFGPLGLQELVAFTVPENTRSRRLMERLGMTHDEREDFEHPRLPTGHPLRRHVLYRLRNTSWG